MEPRLRVGVLEELPKLFAFLFGHWPPSKRPDDFVGPLLRQSALQRVNPDALHTTLRRSLNFRGRSGRVLCSFLGSRGWHG